MTRWAALDLEKWQKAVDEMGAEWKHPLQFPEALGAVAGEHRTRRQKEVDPPLEELRALLLGETAESERWRLNHLIWRRRRTLRRQVCTFTCASGVCLRGTFALGIWRRGLLFISTLPRCGCSRTWISSRYGKSFSQKPLQTSYAVTVRETFLDFAFFPRDCLARLNISRGRNPEGKVSTVRCGCFTSTI